MIKKFTVSLLCIVALVAAVFGGFLFLYFAIPSKEAMHSIELPSHVEDTVSAQQETTEEEPSDTYVADVYQSLTLRETPSADGAEKTSLPPMTHMEVIEFVSGTDYAYVKVTSGNEAGYEGYVNRNYITRLGDSTIRVGTEE